MWSFKPCVNVPMRGGRAAGSGGGLVEMDSSIVWGGGYEDKQVYTYDEGKSQWSRMADGGERGARLAVCEGRLVWVGGEKNGGMCSQKGVYGPVHLCGDGMVVMGGAGDGMRELNDVQVFDGKTQTWHRGPSLPQPCWAKSAVVHGDKVFVMGGDGMAKAVWCADIHDLTAARNQDTQQSIWQKHPDVPYYCSSVCVVDGVVLAIGGAEDQYGSQKTPAIYSLRHKNSPTQVADTVQELSQITSIVNHVEGQKLAISPTIQESHPSLSIDVKRLIREAAKTDEWSDVLSALRIPDKPMLLIQVIDGGGQPSFQEIFPLFISGPSVTLFMFKLTDDLEKPVPVEYQPKDNAGKHKWEDTYVVKECIFHALSSLASSAPDATDKVKNNKLRPQVLLVGTYRDELPGSEIDKKASVERCNGSIVDWVRQTTTFHKAIDVSNNEHTLITDISNLEPNDVRNIKKPRCLKESFKVFQLDYLCSISFSINML
eukprot:Em0007g195a